MLNELNTRIVIFEFMNYHKEDIAVNEVDQLANYMKQPSGRSRILCSNKLPCKKACKQHNTILWGADKNVILFITPYDLSEMCDIKERGEYPAVLIIDLLDRFYLEYE